MSKRLLNLASFYIVILSAGSLYPLIAKADGRPPYPSGGATVFVPFVNAGKLSDPSEYVSPQIKVGFKSSAASTKPFDVTMDTGSVGIIVGSDYFTPPAKGRNDPTFIGLGSETLTSSGFIYTGDWYDTVVNLYDGNGVVASSTVPVMALTKVSCEANARECNPNKIDPTGAGVRYFGIGFAGGAGQPQGTPDKNAFLNVTSISRSNGVSISDATPFSPGYILSTQGVQIGLTSANTQGFAMIKLEPLLAPNSTQWQTTPASKNVLTDWQHPRGTITVNGKSGTGSILFDTGVATGFLTPPIGATVETAMGPSGAECNGSKTPSCAVKGTGIEVSLSDRAPSVVSFRYTVGAKNGAQGGNPVSPFAVSVEDTGAPFLNTTVRFLQAFDYVYDSANGFLGLKTTGKTPAQYAASTPSGFAVEGVFRCFFAWAGANFESSPNGSNITKYKWPYTYHAGVAISSGNSQSGATPATNVNDVYILGADGQSTDEGPLSPWMFASSCQ